MDYTCRKRGKEICVLFIFTNVLHSDQLCLEYLGIFYTQGSGGGGVILSFLDSFHEKCALVLYVGVVRL